MGGFFDFFDFVPEIADNKPQYSVGRFAAFLGLCLPLEVFGDDDSQIPLLICCRQLLIGHVIVALHVVVCDVHHRTLNFINIEIHLPHACPLNKFTDIFYSSIISFGFLAMWQSLELSANLDILLTILVSRSFI